MAVGRWLLAIGSIDVQRWTSRRANGSLLRNSRTANSQQPTATEGAPDGQYIARRLLVLPVVVLGVSVLVFLVLHLVPGNPAQVIAGPDAPPESGCREIEKELGLDRPLPEQYLRYISRVAQGDLGKSLRSKRPVIRRHHGRPAAHAATRPWRP